MHTTTKSDCLSISIISASRSFLSLPLSFTHIYQHTCTQPQSLTVCLSLSFPHLAHFFLSLCPLHIYTNTHAHNHKVCLSISSTSASLSLFLTYTHTTIHAHTHTSSVCLSLFQFPISHTQTHIHIPLFINIPILNHILLPS